MTLATLSHDFASWAHPDLADVMELHLVHGVPGMNPGGKAHGELRYVRAGSGRWMAGLRTFGIAAGDLLYAPPKLQEQLCANAGESLKLDILSVPLPLLQTLEGRAGDWAAARVFRRCRLAGEFAATMRDCLVEKSLGRPAWRQYVAGRAQLLLVHFYRIILLGRQKPALAPASRGDVGRARVMEYIRALEQDFFRSETIDRVAESLGMSSRRFSALFREITGTTWLKYVHGLRVTHAKRLLATKEDPVSLIAFQSGFEDMTTFYRVFKNHTGNTPSEWRQHAARAA